MSILKYRSRRFGDYLMCSGGSCCFNSELSILEDLVEGEYLHLIMYKISFLLPQVINFPLKNCLKAWPLPPLSPAPILCLAVYNIDISFTVLSEDRRGMFELPDQFTLFY